MTSVSDASTVGTASPLLSTADLLRSPRPRWALERAFRLGCLGRQGVALPRGVVLLDDQVSSVSTAVDLLNRGVIPCAERCCVVFSANNRSHYLLFQENYREEALRHLQELEPARDHRLEAPRQSRLSGTTLPMPSSPRTPIVKCRGRSPTGGLRASLKADLEVGCRDRTETWSQQQSVRFCKDVRDQYITEEDLKVASAAARRALEQAEEVCLNEIEEHSPSKRESKSQQEEMDIGLSSFRLLGVIGRGAFGVVQKAVELCSEDKGYERVAAVKFMTAKTAQAFETAIFEADLLRLLTASLGSKAIGRVPQYFGHNAVAKGNGGEVHLAMSFISGVVLDQWVYGISDAQHKRVDVNELVYGRLPNGRQQTLGLHEACHMTHCLLEQIASVMGALEPFAFHRDVSSHNVMINFPSAKEDGTMGNPNFALIDFGLAVNSRTWNDVWNRSNLAGDPRYWTAAAWMAFAFGFNHVEYNDNQGHVRQYLSRVDHYGVGILGLEIFFAVWDGSQPDEDFVGTGLRETRAAWRELWEDVVRLFQLFHVSGPSVAREYLTTTDTGGIALMVSRLGHIRGLLRAAARDKSNSPISGMLRSLADLIDEEGTFRWEDIVSLVRERPQSRSPMKGLERSIHSQRPTPLDPKVSARIAQEACSSPRKTLATSCRGFPPASQPLRMRSHSPTGSRVGGLGGTSLPINLPVSVKPLSPRTSVPKTPHSSDAVTGDHSPTVRLRPCGSPSGSNNRQPLSSNPVSIGSPQTSGRMLLNPVMSPHCGLKARSMAVLPPHCETRHQQMSQPRRSRATLAVPPTSMVSHSHGHTFAPQARIIVPTVAVQGRQRAMQPCYHSSKSVPSLPGQVSPMMQSRCQ